AEWTRAHGSAFRVNVNLSAKNFNEPGLIDAVAEAIASSGIEPSRLVLEMTETGLLAGEPIEEDLRALKSLGVRLAIDDFGTGYASLSYLQRFPIDMIKIDRAFVGGTIDAAQRARDGWALARAIVRMGQALGIETVAEGVEAEWQREALMRLGCKTGQGFLFSQPLPSNAIPALLAEESRARARSAGGSSRACS
ncbi:MAG: EAL domain-containing protein, partial [Actinomycetota bacterium]